MRPSRWPVRWKWPAAEPSPRALHRCAQRRRDADVTAPTVGPFELRQQQNVRRCQLRQVSATAAAASATAAFAASAIDARRRGPPSGRRHSRRGGVVQAGVSRRKECLGGGIALVAACLAAPEAPYAHQTLPSLLGRRHQLLVNALPLRTCKPLGSVAPAVNVTTLHPPGALAQAQVLACEAVLAG